MGRRRLASEARAARRRKIVTQAVENRPSRPKTAPPSVGSAVASAAARRAALGATRREANHAAPARFTVMRMAPLPALGEGVALRAAPSSGPC
jgi:hypothetical protein